MGKRISTVVVALALATGVVACGDDEETTATDTATDTTLTVAPPETTATAPSSENPSGETADLPLCAEVDVRPCRTAGGAVLEEGGANAGEIGDLPLCSQSPPPCRTASGELVEP
jgi:hypothetical protein